MDNRIDHGAPTLAAPLEGELSPVGLHSFNERYEVREKLGEGGMGEVHVIRDRVIGRDVAIKRLRGGTPADPSDEIRFLREARVQGQLEHPAIVPVYDMGRDGDGAAYFAMKRIRGVTLQRMIEGMRASEHAGVQHARRRLLTAFSSVCMAVDFAHRRGVLHRDLKPANIMLGDFGEVYVLDWGVAKLNADGAAPPKDDAAPIESDPGQQTVAGSALGTPGYMSPEQVSGEPLDERSDVYALGLMLFELLALEPLHQGETMRQLHTSTLKGPDAHASSRAPGKDVPPELDAICVKATALEPRERHASARELCEAIERYLDGDRDVVLRRELANTHAKIAAEARVRVSENGCEEDRSRALAEVGRALALDPANALAMKTMVGLLSEPPATVPPEAQRELAAAGRRTAAVFARSGPLGLILAFACTPLFLWLGVRSFTALIAILALWAALAWARRAAVPVDSDGTLPYRVPLIGFAAAGASSLVFGPFILVPLIALLLSFNASMVPGRSRRALITTLAVASWLVPWALQRAGVFPGGLLLDGSSLVVLPAAFDFPPIVTEVALIATNAGVLLVGLTIAARLRRRLSDAERGLVLQSWQLRQLIPPEARVLP